MFWLCKFGAIGNETGFPLRSKMIMFLVELSLFITEASSCRGILHLSSCLKQAENRSHLLFHTICSSLSRVFNTNLGLSKELLDNQLTANS